jgi:hypothetical protein
MNEREGKGEGCDIKQGGQHGVTEKVIVEGGED